METNLTLGIHGVTLAGVLVILGLVFTQHKIWIRIKDRVNTLWFDHCKQTGERFESLDNGR